MYMINKLLKYKYLFFAAAILVLLSILFLRESKVDLVSDYEIDYVDIEQNMSIYYNDPKWGGIGVINPTVFAVGYNEDFIIAKQHPNDNFEVDRTVTNYFIIPIKYKISESPEENKIGPLNEEKFDEKCRELRISGVIDFTIIFDELR